ncbi:MAG: hypothetical protein V4796_31490 [Burkholderia cenocepacia]
MNEIKKALDTRAAFEEWAKPYWFCDSQEECHADAAKDAAWDAWEERSALIDDMALILEILAADADAGKAMIPSGLRLSIDAVLIKAGRKEAPVPVRHITVAGVDR